MIAAALSAIWTFLKGLPAWVYIAIGCAIGVYCYGLHEKHVGAAEVQAKWDAANLKAEREAQEKHDIDQADMAGVGLSFSQEAQKERVIEKKIYERITEYVPTTDPLLSGGFRLLHDAAALGEALGDRSGTDAAPVSSQDVAKTIADNYAECRLDKIHILKLQEAVKILNR